MKKILLIDDDVRMLRLLKNYLDKIYQVIPIKSGMEALEYLKDNKPDLILLDYLMPALDGPSTLKLIRKIDGCSDIPVFFLSGITQKECMTECMELNPKGYLVKPVAREELLNEIRQVFSE